MFAPQVLTTTKQITCPDCLGERTWLARLPCGDELKITCPTCERGYVNTGTVPLSESTGKIRRLTIGSVRTDSAAEPERMIEYMCNETGVGSGTVWPEWKLCATREEAEAALPALVENHRVMLVESRAASVSRSRTEGVGRMAAHYRGQIRQARRDIAAAEAGLMREARKD